MIGTKGNTQLLSKDAQRKRERWWLSCSPPIVDRIAEYLCERGFGSPRWSADQLDCFFWRSRDCLIDEVRIGAKHEGGFSTSFAIRCERTTDIEIQLGLVTSDARLREFQLSAIRSGPEILVFADSRGLAPAAQIGMTHQETYVTAEKDLVGPALHNWTLLVERLWPYFFDVFKSPLTVAHFCLGAVPLELQDILKRDPTSIAACGGHVKRFLFGAILFGLERKFEEAELALKYFSAATESQYGNERGRAVELIDARRYTALVGQWLQIRRGSDGK